MPEHINCAEAEAHLLDYLKRELTPEVAAEMKAHLEKCRPCFKQAQFEENFLLMLETRARRETCPGKLRERILALLRAEAERG
jgi:anti-sigma factor (TIGR02949 family)